MSGWLADLVVVVHFLFIAFVAGGALLLFRWHAWRGCICRQPRGAYSWNGRGGSVR